MKAIIIEDSRLAREGLIRMLQCHPDIEVIGAADHPEAARQLMATTRPELLFLDIHMPGESGFEFLETLDYLPKIIFTTAYSEYAVRSFDYNTVDYLLKPISEERLATAIAKLTTNTENTANNPPPHDSPPQDMPLTLASRIFIKDNEQCFLVEVGSIRYIESCKNYVRLFFDSRKAFIKKSLNLVEQRLPPQDFFRANRQYLVNMHAITDIQPSVGDGYQLTMSDGEIIEVSRRNASLLKDRLSL